MTGKKNGEEIRAIQFTAFLLCPCCDLDGPLGLGVMCRRMTMGMQFGLRGGSVVPCQPGKADGIRVRTGQRILIAI